MKPFFVGISGASGSGKSTLAKNLAKRYKTYAIDLDDYFINKKRIPFLGKWRNAELPSNIKFELLHKHLKKLKSGKGIRSPIYRWKEGKPIKYRAINPGPIIFIEGNYLLYKKEIRELIALKIYLLAPEKVLLKHRIQRTGKENLEYYKTIVYPHYKKYALPTKKYADKVIRVTESLNKIEQKIITLIKRACPE